MIIIQDAVISFIEKIKDAKRIYKLIAFAVLALLLIAVSVFSSGVRLTYNVMYNGKILANVSNVEIYEKGMELASACVPSEKHKIAGAEVEAVITVNSKSATSEEIKEIILANSPSVKEGYEILIGGKRVAYVTDPSFVDKTADARLNAFNIDGVECENSFNQDISVRKTYVHEKLLCDNSVAIDAINKMDVVTVATKKTVYAVKYDTETKKDSTKNAGYVSVVTKGINGENQKMEQVTYLNGVATSEPVVSEVVLKFPVNEVKLIGTKNIYVHSAPQNASASGFKWPLATRGVITSYWGDNRGHKGVDIAVPTGTKVLAVKAGTVVEQGYRTDYGYYVLIDHGNGVKTRYAHNSQNLVEVGKYVTANQVIALSGNTGRSTGPHLHFEVIINGNRVNPASFINLG